MFWKSTLALMIVVCTAGFVKAQTIVYSEPDRDDERNMNFAIIGKINDHFLILKNARYNYAISVLDNDMKQVDKIKLSFLPDRVINTEVLAYKNFFYLFYQYQKRNTVYCMGAKFNGDGKMMSDPIELDTTHINFYSANKIYSVINSDDKQRIAVFKINSRYSDNYGVTTVLFDADLKPIKKTYLHIPMPERNDFLTEFSVGNDGSLVFARASGTAQSDNINTVSLLVKGPLDDSVSISDVIIPKIYLDDIRIKINNANRHLLVTSFYANSKRGNVDGLFCSIWDIASFRELYNTRTTFSEDFRAAAKTNGSTRSALNDFYLQDIVMRKDGGFVIAAEAAYSSSRGGYSNRWDYLYGSPYWNTADNFMYGNAYGSGYYPWGRPGYSGFQITRFYADNIAVVSFDSVSNLEWSKIIPKEQYDDNTDNLIGYGTLNAGTEVHFLFNEQQRRTLILSDQSITPDGEVHRNPTLHNLDRGFDFMPRLAKQVGSHQLIVPCQYRTYVCFAKIDF